MSTLPGHDLLAPDGGLAAAMPGYEDRRGQREMSEAVARAIEDERPLVVEAGTGTGKTLAYLVPAVASGKRVVISTGTKSLQDQLARHDIPLLRTISPRPFEAVVLKGISNYVCRRRLAEAIARTASGTTAADREAARQLAAIQHWADRSATGDRAEVDDLAEDAPVWAEATTTPESRVGKSCPHFERCFVTQARRAAETADLIVVNHHLYFADLALRGAFPGARVLPDHDVVIFDEAHQLEDVATEHFGARVSSVRIGQLVRDAHVAFGHLALWSARTTSSAGAILAVERAEVALFGLLRAAIRAAEVPGATGGRTVLPAHLFDEPARQTAWFRLDGALEDLAREADNDSEASQDGDGHDDGAESSGRTALVSIARRARALRDDLAIIAEQRQVGQVYWGEVRPTGTHLTAAPVQVADKLRRVIVDGAATAIFTSATLTTGGDFGYTRTRLGLDVDRVDALTVESPFDYAQQAMLYVPRDLPEPSGDADGSMALMAPRIIELLALTSGHAFVLFTSHRALQAAARALAGLPYPLLIQGDAPRATLIERFRTTPHAVLLGTGSFWEGVDVPGDALRLVIIDKLPFAPHLDPLVAGRGRVIAERGGDPFTDAQLPAAVIALRQGFGRLIRRRDDRGIVAVLDGRIVSRGYGRVFLDSLPAGLPRTSSLEQVRRWWTGVVTPTKKPTLAGVLPIAAP